MFIRSANFNDAGGIARVQISSWQTTYQGIVPDTFLKNMDVVERTLRWQMILSNDAYETFIAENDKGDIVGFINGGEERTKKYEYDGELYAIYILKEYQRKGLGGKLVRFLAETLKTTKGYEQLLVWVLEENASRYFYESLGAVKVDEKKITIGGIDLTEIAYGWKNIKNLCDRLGS